MPKMISLLALACAIVISPMAIAESQEEAQEKCKQFAQEEQVSADEMEAYMAECVQTLTEATSKEDK